MANLRMQIINLFLLIIETCGFIIITNMSEFFKSINIVYRKLHNLRKIDLKILLEVIFL
jgi:hypothetical protein